MPSNEDFRALDARLLSELKRLVRSHRIVIDPENSPFDVVRTGVQDNRDGLSGPEAYRYRKIAEEAWQLHSELSGNADNVAVPEYSNIVHERALKLIKKISSLADEPAPVRLPKEPFSRLLMYFLPLLVAPAGLALLLYYPASKISILAGVAVANIGFLAGTWSWRVRFEKWPGARSLWAFVAIYVAGLTLIELLSVVGLIRTP